MFFTYKNSSNIVNFLDKYLLLILYFYGSEKNTLTTKSIIDITGGE